MYGEFKAENPRVILSVIRDIIKKEKPRGIFKRAIGNSKQKLYQGDDFQSSPNASGDQLLEKQAGHFMPRYGTWYPSKNVKPL